MWTKKIFTGLLLLVVSFSLGIAQQDPPRKGPPTKEERLSHLKDVLNLTKDQVKKVTSILDFTQKKMVELRDKDSKEHREYMDAVKIIHNEEDSKIEKILTKDQKKIFEKMKNEREKRNTKPGERRPPHQ
jgi:hypothetical protein